MVRFDAHKTRNDPDYNAAGDVTAFFARRRARAELMTNNVVGGSAVPHGDSAAPHLPSSDSSDMCLTGACDIADAAGDSKRGV